MPDVTPESLRGWAKTMESQYHRNYPLVSVERGAAIAFHAAADEIERLTAKANQDRADWQEAKTEFGDIMAKTRVTIARITPRAEALAEALDGVLRGLCLCTDDDNNCVVVARTALAAWHTQER